MILKLTRRDFMAASAALLAGTGLRAQASPFAILDLNHVSIGVADIERSLEFYQRLFDLTVFTSQAGGNLPIMTIGAGPQFVALSQRRPGSRGGVGHHFCVHMENFDPERVMRQLAELEVEARIFPWTYDGRRYDLRPAAAQRPLVIDAADTPELVFDDPDGVLLQIQDARYCGGAGALGELCGIPESPPRRRAAFAAYALNHVSIPVSDVQRSLAYYRRVFGFAHRTSQAGGAVPILTVGAGPQFVALREGTGGGHHFCLSIAGFDPDRVMETLADHGVESRLRLRPAAEQRPAAAAGTADTPEITFLDPDGITVQIQDASYAGGVDRLGDVIPF